jgi:hypothetical protein
MADTSPREAARKRAQNHFAAAQERDATVRQMIDGERAASDAKTAKLRALRLAKEEYDRANPPAPVVKAKAAPRRKKAAV